MNVVIIADDDSLIGGIECEPVDLLISCGDLHDVAIERAIARYRPRRTLAVKGNHDPAGEFASGITDLHLSLETIDGIRFGGFGGSWRYKPRGHHLFEQAEVSAILRGFPRVDVFVAHNSPAGMHERDTDVHQGFQGFAEYVKRHQPRLFLHGHQHVDCVSIQGETTVIGVYGERLLKLEKAALAS